MSRVVKCLLVTDSRGHNFDKYSRSEFDFPVDFILQRGATIHELIQPTVLKLQTYHYTFEVVVRLSAGINDLLSFVTAGDTRVFEPSTQTPDSLFNELEEFKRIVTAAHPTCRVIFSTIPPASFSKF